MVSQDQSPATAQEDDFSRLEKLSETTLRIERMLKDAPFRVRHNLTNLVIAPADWACSIGESEGKTNVQEISDLMTVAEATEQYLVNTSFSPDPVAFGDVLDLLHTAGRHIFPDKKRVSCTVTGNLSDDNVGEMISLDVPKFLIGIVTNLCTNAETAVNALPSDQRSEERRTVTMNALLNEDSFLLKVADRAGGMSAEKVAAFNASAIESDESSHRGHGLRTLLDAVAMHGGTASVESTPGAGTTFRVVLPRGSQIVS